jgi:nucleotide-binding universal stress UspA family protein
MRIMVAYDGSDPAKRALERVASLLGDNEITVLSVVPVLSGAGRGGGIDPTSDVGDHRKMLDEAAALLADRGVQAKALEAVGHPAEVIVDVAAKEKFDLVAIGPHEHGVVQRILGSTTSHVVGHAACDVLVVR